MGQILSRMAEVRSALIGSHSSFHGSPGEKRCYIKHKKNNKDLQLRYIYLKGPAAILLIISSDTARLNQIDPFILWCAQLLFCIKIFES